ncbi:MAG: hypothetical protein D6689_18205 [Deltaproteobacteria bacterium]|nr:MAG: hypothetical protein D6689_18205 [Deltaproteobacteria bacterium]
MTTRAWRRAAALASFSLAACNDPVVHVSMQLPDDLRGALAAVTLDVIVPPPAEPFDCDAVAFQSVPPDTVALGRVQQVVLTSADRVPIEVPREGDKLFVARGLDRQDDPVLAACASLGTVDEDVSVDLVPEPVTLLSPPSVALGDPLPSTLRATVTDLAGHPLAGAPVVWRVYGPGGEGEPGDAVTDAQGRAELTVDVPAAPGPAAVVAASRWMAAPPEPIVGFREPETLSVPVPVGVPALPRNAVRYVVGRIGPAGEPGFAVFGEPSGGGSGRAVFFAYRDGDAFRTAESPPVPGLLALGLARGAERDEVFTIVADRWIEIRPDGSLSATPLPTSGLTATEIRSVGACDLGGDPDVVLAHAGDQWVALTAERAIAASVFATPPDGAQALLGTGCATATTGALRRVALYAVDSGPPVVVADLNGRRQTVWPVFGQAVGFSRALPGRAAPLLGVEVDIDGFAIARYELVASGAAGLDLQKIGADDAITVPVTPAGGDFDGDGVLDVAAILEFGRTDDDETAFRSQITLGVTLGAGGPHLSGVSREAQLPGPRLFVADATGDGIDDLWIASADEVVIAPGGAP